MKARLWILSVALLMLPISLFSQTCSNKTVTATITDSDAQAWVNGSYTVTLSNPSGGQRPVCTATGIPITTTYSGTLNGSGALSVSLPDTSKVDPAGVRWIFSIQPNASVSASVMNPIALTANVSLTASFSSQVTVPRFFANIVGPASLGYNDNEPLSPVEGSSYLVSTTGFMRTYHNGAWQIGGGGTGVTWANDLAGSTNASQTVVGIRSKPVPTLATGALTYDLVSNTWSFVPPPSLAGFDVLATPNTHTTGNQQVNTGANTNVGRIVKGSLSASSTPPVGVHGDFPSSFPTCSATLTVTTGDKILLLGIPTTPGQALNTPTGTRGETYVSIATVPTDLTQVWLSTAVTSTGSDSLSLTGAGDSCGGGAYWNVGPGVSVDGTPATHYTASATNPETVGPTITAVAGDLLYFAFATTSFRSGCSGSGLTVNTAGYTNQTANGARSTQATYSATAGAAGSYSVSLNTSTTGCTAGQVLVALTGPGIPQIADLDQYQSSAGVVLGAIDNVGKLRSAVYSSETVTFSATPIFSTATNYSEITLTGNITSFTLGNGGVGQGKTLCFTQDATGGRTVVAPSNVLGLSVGTAANSSTCQLFNYSNAQSKWLASSNGFSSVALAMPTGSLAANTCSGVTVQALANVTSKSTFKTAFVTSPLAVTGWGANGGLVLSIWPDVTPANGFDWAVCNQTTSAITGGAISINVSAN